MLTLPPFSSALSASYSLLAHASCNNVGAVFLAYVSHNVACGFDRLHGGVLRLTYDVGHFGLAATEQCHGDGCDGDDARNEADDDADGLWLLLLRIVVHVVVRCLLHGAGLAG